MNCPKEAKPDYTTIYTSQASVCPTFRTKRNHQAEQSYNQKAKSSEKQRKQQQKRVQISDESNQESFVMSQSSLRTIPIIESIQLQQRFNKLQQWVTQQILSLRQQKLTLMQQHNKCIQNRFKVHRQLNKLKKKNQKQQKIQSEFISKKQSQMIPTKESQNQVEQKNHNTVSSAEVKIYQKIKNLNIYCKQLQKKLYQSEKRSPSKKIGSIQKNKNQASSQKNKKPGSIKKTNNYQYWQQRPIDTSEVSIYMSKLKAKKQTLIDLILCQPQNQQLKKSLLRLRKSNEQLQEMLDSHLHEQKNIVQSLKERISQQEQEKKRFLQDLISFKAKSKQLRLQNQELRKAIRYFKY